MNCGVKLAGSWRRVKSNFMTKRGLVKYTKWTFSKMVWKEIRILVTGLQYFYGLESCQGGGGYVGN